MSTRANDGGRDPAHVRDWRLYLAALGGVAAVHAVVVWVPAVFPGQDIPQHLSFVRILRDLGQPGTPFAAHFEGPEAFHPYHTTYWLMVWLARVTSVDVALRVLWSVYAVGLFAAFHALVVTVHGARFGGTRAPWTALLAGLFVFGPMVAMGFVAFSLGAVLVVAGCAALLKECARGAPSRPPVRSIAVALAAAAVHPAALGCLLLFAVGLMLDRTRIARRRAAAVVAAGGCALIGFWALSDVGEGTLANRDLSDVWRNANLLDAADGAVGAVWRSPLEKLNDVLWTVLGPYRLEAMAVTVLALAVLWIATRRARQAAGSASHATPSWRTHARACLVFGAVAAFAPFGIDAPDDLFYLDFRLIVVVVVLAAALVPPAWVAARAPRAVVVALPLLAAGQFVYASHVFDDEARAPMALLDRVEPDATLTAVVMDGRSAAFGKQFQPAHFLPTYFTARDGGISTQFWGRYVPHLPVEWRDGAKPAHPPDWKPEWLRIGHLETVDYIVARFADPADAPRWRVEGSRLVRDVLTQNAEEIDCEASWCLYRCARDRVAAAPAGDDLRL